MPTHDKIPYPVREIADWIASGRTHQSIADELRRTLDPRVTPKLIYKVCKKHGIKCQRTGPRAGKGHPEWKGGVIRSKLGYVRVYCPEHPTCQRTNARRAEKANGKYYTKARYVWEHRLVMEQELGRYLAASEVVHHVNGVKDDNRPENLMLFRTNAEHLEYDLAGKCPSWSPDGKARILAAIWKRSAMIRQRKELDALERKRTNHRTQVQREPLTLALS